MADTTTLQTSDRDRPEHHSAVGMEIDIIPGTDVMRTSETEDVTLKRGHTGNSV
jgi:hypothetical protein